MGMDVHGINPQQNKSMEDFPLLTKMKELEENDDWKTRRKLLDNNDINDKYWAEKEKYEGKNKGVYFRNNCWWWRPLWNYCATIAPDLIDDDLYQSGHHNDGAGLDDEGAKALGTKLLKEIANGNTIKYQAEYQQKQDDSDDDFASSYPFDVDNVAEFANFCLECGGFKIC